jgi:hypothetical protein
MSSITTSLTTLPGLGPLYKAASKGLFGNTEQDKYNLTPKGLLTFLNEFAVQAKECSWTGMFTINTTPAAVADQLQPSQYSSIKLTHISMVVNPIHCMHNTHEWQNDIAMYYCQMNSLTKLAKNTIHLHKKDFTTTQLIPALGCCSSRSSLLKLKCSPSLPLLSS